MVGLSEFFFRYTSIFLFKTFFLFGPLFILGSCQEYAFQADLLVTVKGIFTGNPKEGLPVQVFETREDAENHRYPVAPVVYTDYFGEVVIYGLHPGKEYFVRVDGFLSSKIKDTRRLREGSNAITLRLL